MFEEDRPIKPDRKYLQEQQQKHQQFLKNQKRNVLHKGRKQMLACHKENHQILTNILKNKQKQANKLSKAEKYQQIKKVNRQKFGEWDKHKNHIQKQKTQKKINPKFMTINYKPKKPKIDTRQYKKSGYIQDPNMKMKKTQLQEKMEYKKMVEYMKKLYAQFQVEKEKFDKEKEYLKFKKQIQNTDGIKIQAKTQKQHLKKDTLSKQRGSMPNLNKNRNIMNHQQKRNNQIQSNSNVQILNQQQKQLQHQNEQQQRQNDSTKIKQFRYSIQKLNQCHPFTLKQIYNYANKQQFLFQNCALYQKAKQIIQNQRSTAIVQSIKPKCTHGSIGSNHSVCLQEQCAEKRITKFNGNWFQLWIAGKYRTMYNKEIGYKVIWYGNGDVKQQLNRGKVNVYQSKAKKVIQINVEGHLPFWYFPFINQLQTKNENGDRQVIFNDGRHEIIMAQNNI